MSLFKLIKKEEEEPEEELEAPETPPPPERTTTKKVVHRARYVRANAAEPAETEPNEAEASEGGIASENGNPPETPRPPTGRARGRMGSGQTSAMGLSTDKFRTLTDKVKKAGPALMPRKYLMRTALWDFSSIFSLVMNAILVGIVLLLLSRINTLQNTLNGLLGGLYDNFVRMDRSYITTTIQVNDMPIPLDFVLPVVQEQTNVTLTQAVTVRNAYVVIDTGQLSISAPATVTLPVGTTLPVSLRMDVPVQTTVLMDLQVPVNIELSRANSSDPAIANLHTAFLGLQDTIGPLYCLLEPAAMDYLSQPLCDSEGRYIGRTPPTP